MPANLGDALSDLGEPEAAYAAYLRAGAGGDAYGWYWAGRVLRWLGRLDDALVRGRSALDGGAMSVAHFASWLADAKHYDEAVDLLRAAGDDGDGDSLVELGAIEQERRRLAAAEVVLRRAVAANASDAHVYLANALKGLGRPQEGLAVLREGADQGDPSAQLQLANELAREDIDNPEIEALLRRAIERGDEGAETNLGIHLLELGRREEAIEILKRTADQGDELARQTLLDAFAHPPEASE